MNHEHVIPAKAGIITRRGSAPGQSVPLPMLRVARIVPEFCARTRPESGVTPCAGRNKEFFARGVFYLFNCCTNVAGSCRFAGGIPTHDFANSAALRPACFAHHDTPLILQHPAREHVHKGGSGAWTLRTYPPPTRHPNGVACTCDVLRRRFMGRTPLADGPSADSYGRSPIEGFAFLIPVPSACARSFLVPGTCDLTDRPTDASDSAAPCAWNSPTIPAP